MSKPNLFKYATSELSQDAFICWLLEWAKESNSQHDPALHQTGSEVLNAMFDACKCPRPDVYRNVEVIRQHKHIDVLVVINRQYALVIEDKTGTEDHDGQLNRYWKEISDNGVKVDDQIVLRFDENRILKIYLKTGDQSNYDRVKAQGYIPFLRENMLPILQEGKTLGVQNAIYDDYLSYLKDIENGIMSYQSIKLEDNWQWPSWIGFFKALNSELGSSGFWQYCLGSA